MPQSVGRILIVEDEARSAARMVEGLARTHTVTVESDPQTGLLKLLDEGCDLLIVSLSLSQADGLRLVSQVRSLERTRHLPIIVLVEPGDEPRLMRGLDMGVNDYLMRPVERNEMLARVRTQIKRKRHSDRIRARLEESVELSVVDPLTGLHNRRYMEDHLRTLVAQAIRRGRPLSLLIADIDHFKAVNDTWGHDVGDKVLRQVAQRFRQNIRSMDLACRFGGEEFVGIMPDLDLARALQVGERLRASIAGDVITVGPGGHASSDGKCWFGRIGGLGRHAGQPDQEGRSGAIRGQAPRPQPRHERCRLILWARADDAARRRM